MPSKRHDHPETTGEAHIDESLIDAALAMTVRQRLEQNDRTIRTIAKLRSGFAKLKATEDGTHRRSD